MPSVFDHPIITERYFFPRKDRVENAWWVETGGVRLSCWLATPCGADAPLLVHFHGNGEVVGDYLPEWPEMLAAWGYNVLLAEYRGYGMSSGTPQLAAMLDDTEAIIEQSGVAPSSMVVFGRSVGSIYAIEAVRRFPDIAGLVLESGIADPLERVLLRAAPDELGTTADALRKEGARLLDHESKLGGYRGPTLILHARHDHLVDMSHAERNHAWAAGADKRLCILPRGDHNSIFFANSATYTTELRAFLEARQP